MISIIMPVYNAEKFIRETIESMLRQTYSDFELIVVDDCSSDNSIKILESFNDERIKILKNDKNSGAAITRNNAYIHAKGNYVAFLDSDDIWNDNYLELQLNFLKNNNYDFVYCAWDMFGNKELKKNKFLVPEKVKYKNILKQNVIPMSGVLYNRNTLGDVLFPTNAIKREDMGAWLNVLKKIKYAYGNNEVFVKYRMSDNSVSSNKKEMMKYQWHLYRKVEKINIISSFYFLLIWGLKGLKKYK